MVAYRDPADAILAELGALEDDLELLTEAEFTSEQEFGDALLNNLPAITYALGAGMPVTGWRPAAKNPNEAERVQRAVRQWGQGARSLIVQLSQGTITLDDFYNQMLLIYRRHARNAYVAGRRAMGNLAPLDTAAEQALADEVDSTAAGLADWMNAQTGAAGGGVSALLVQMFLDPTNYLGSGLPGDPFAGLPPPLGVGKKDLKALQKEADKLVRAGKAVPNELQARIAKMAPKAAAASDLGTAGTKIDNLGDSIRAMAPKGELSAFDSPETASSTLVWWNLGAADHCIDCIRLSEGSPYYADMFLGNGISPGSGHTRCGGHCQCTLEYDVPSEVCTDVFGGAGSLGDLGFIESADGRMRVWVQEASTCSNPVGIDMLASRLDTPQTMSDEAAFSWDQDFAATIRGDVSTTTASWEDVLAAAAATLRREEAAHVRAVVDQPEAMSRAAAWLRDYLPGHDVSRLKVTRYEIDGSVYHAFWQRTADSVRFELGTTTAGVAMLNPDFTLRAISDLSREANRLGLRLEINGGTLDSGMRKWLETIGADTLRIDGRAPVVFPDWEQQAAIAARTNGAAVIPNPADATWAVTQYGGSDAYRVNAALRAGGVLDPADARIVAGLDAALEPLPGGEVFYRGVGPDVIPNPTVGGTFTDRAYLSVHANREVAADYASYANGVVLRIDAPAGMPGLKMPGAAGEWTLGRNIRMEITDVRQVDGVTEIGLRPTAVIQPAPGIAPRAIAEVDALPAWPDMGLLKEMPGTGGLAGTNHEKKLLVDPSGKHWMFRPGGEAAPEDAAGRIAGALGMRTPPVRMVEWDGARGTLQPIIPNAKSITGHLIDENSSLRGFEVLNEAQAAEVMRQTVLDYLVANIDAHSGNWLIDDAGRVWGIDRSRAMVGAVATSEKVPTWLDQAAGIVSDVIPPRPGAKPTIFDAPPGLILPKLHPDVLDGVLARLDNITDAEYVGLIGREAAEAVSMPFGTLDKKMGALVRRKHEARDGFEEWFRGLAGQPDAPDEWKAWLKAGGTFGSPPPAAIPEIPLSPGVIPSTGEAVRVPVTYRSSAAVKSTAGNDLAIWQKGFHQASTREHAITRLEEVLGKTHGNILDGYTLEQLNMVLARAEHMRSLGIDLTPIRRLGDFSHVPLPDQTPGVIGLTYKGKIMALDTRHEWAYLAGVDSPATVYNDIGGLFAHEYGHVMFANLSSTDQARVLDLYLSKVKGAEAGLSNYAAKDADEWFGEVIAAITTPGYERGSIAYDDELWGILVDDGMVHGVSKADGLPPLSKPAQYQSKWKPAPPEPSVLPDPVGPAIPAPEKAWFAPHDPQMYTVPNSDLPLNAPLVEWSGYIPPEPPPPEILVTAEQRAAAKEARDAVVKRIDDIADGKVDVALSWTKADADEAVARGYALDKIGNEWVIGRTDADLEPLRAYVAKGGATGEDGFWHLLGYSDRDLAAYDHYETLGKPIRPSAGVMIVEPDGRIWLLAPRNEFGGYQNTVIKGGVDPGETLAQAAVRETREEIGLSVELDAYLGDYFNPTRTGLTRMYVGHRSGGGPLWAKLKETHQVRLVTPEEAKKLLTQYGKPSARDQAILSDAVAALTGTPGAEHLAIPEGAVAELAAKTTTPEAVLWSPPEKAAGYGPTAVKSGIAPDQPVGTAFGWQHSTLKTYDGLEAVTPPAAKFPYSQTRWDLPNGEKATMYWQQKPDGSLFWANSKKQVTDPHTRLTLHALQLAKLSDVAAQTGASVIRVSDDLLSQVPKLRELLVASGATKTGKVLELDGDSLIALGKAIMNNDPLPISAGVIPAAPLSPVPKTVIGIGKAPVDNVSTTLGTLVYSEPGVFQVMPLTAPAPLTVSLSRSGDNLIVKANVLAHPEILSEEDLQAVVTVIVAEASQHAKKMGLSTIALDPQLTYPDAKLAKLWTDLVGDHAIGSTGWTITTPMAGLVADATNYGLDGAVLPTMKAVPDGMGLDEATKIAKILDQTELKALEDYSGGDYFWGVSDYLRKGNPPDDDTLRIVKELDSAMGKAPEAKGPLYRGLGYESPFPDGTWDVKPGMKFTDKSFGSTSTNQASAGTYGTTILQIEPSGVHGINVSDALGINDYINQEVVLERNVEYVVTKVETKSITIPDFLGGTGQPEEFKIVHVAATKPGAAAPVAAVGAPLGEIQTLSQVKATAHVLDGTMDFPVATEAQKSALESYTGGASVNGDLLGDVFEGQTGAYSALAEVPVIDDWMANSVMPEDVTLYRGAISAPGIKPGDTVSQASYASTSLSPNVGAHYATVAAPPPHGDITIPTLYRIQAPKGSHALWMEPKSLNPGEYEVLLPRGQKFRVTAVHEGVDLSPMGGVWEVGSAPTRVVDLVPIPDTPAVPTSGFLTSLEPGPNMLPDGAAGANVAPLDGYKAHHVAAATGKSDLDQAIAEWFDWDKASAMKDASAGTLKPGAYWASGGTMTDAEVAQFQKQADLIQAAAEANRTTKKSVYRGAIVEPDQVPKVGDVWTAEGLTATAPDPGTAAGYAQQYGSMVPEAHQVVYQFHDPKGIMGVPGFGDPDLPSATAFEVIMPKGAQYKVVDTWMGADGIQYVKAEVVTKAETAAIAAVEPSANPLLDMIDKVTDLKATTDAHPLSLATFPTPGGQSGVTWRRLGNVLEIHAMGGTDAPLAFRAQLVRMGKTAEQYEKITHLKLTATWLSDAQSHQWDDLIALLKDAGAVDSAGGLKIQRENLIALKDQLLASAVAQAPMPAEIGGLVKELGLETVQWGSTKPIITAQKQGFTKIEWQLADTELQNPTFATVRYRTLSDRIAVTSAKAESDSELMIGAVSTLSHLGDQMEANPALKAIRFDDSSMLDLKIGLRQRLETDYGLYRWVPLVDGVPDEAHGVWLMSREGAIKFRDDVAKSLDTTAVHAVATAPPPVVTQSFVESLGSDPAAVKALATNAPPPAGSTMGAFGASRTWEVGGHEVTTNWGITADGRMQFKSAFIGASPEGAKLSATEARRQALLAELAKLTKYGAATDNEIVLMPAIMAGPWGQDFKAALIDAGAWVDEDVLVIGPNLSKSLADAIEGAAEIVPPPVSVAAAAVPPPAPSVVATLSGQMGFDVTKLEPLAPADYAAMKMGSVTTGGGVNWTWMHMGSSGQVKDPLILFSPTASSIAPGKSAEQGLIAVTLQASKALDTTTAQIVVVSDMEKYGVGPLAKALGYHATLIGSNEGEVLVWAIDKDGLAAAAKAIESNTTLRHIGGSAAADIPMTTAGNIASSLGTPEANLFAYVGDAVEMGGGTSKAPVMILPNGASAQMVMKAGDTWSVTNLVTTPNVEVDQIHAQAMALIHAAAKKADADGTALWIEQEIVGWLPELEAAIVEPFGGGMVADDAFMPNSAIKKFLKAVDDQTPKATITSAPGIPEAKAASVFGPKYDIDVPGLAALPDPTVTKMAQGFEKLDWSVPGASTATVKLRVSSTTVSLVQTSGDPVMRKTAFVHSLEDIRGRVVAEPGIKTVRIGTGMDATPGGMFDMLGELGGELSKDDKWLTFDRDTYIAGMQKLKDDLAGVPGSVAGPVTPSIPTPATLTDVASPNLQLYFDNLVNQDWTGQVDIFLDQSPVSFKSTEMTWGDVKMAAVGPVPETDPDIDAAVLAYLGATLDQAPADLYVAGNLVDASPSLAAIVQSEGQKLSNGDWFIGAGASMEETKALFKKALKAGNEVAAPPPAAIPGTMAAPAQWGQDLGFPMGKIGDLHQGSSYGKQKVTQWWADDTVAKYATARGVETKTLQAEYKILKDRYVFTQVKSLYGGSKEQRAAVTWRQIRALAQKASDDGRSVLVAEEIAKRPGVATMLMSVGGTPKNFSVYGDGIEITAAQAKDLVAKMAAAEGAPLAPVATAIPWGTNNVKQYVGALEDALMDQGDMTLWAANGAGGMSVYVQGMPVDGQDYNVVMAQVSMPATAAELDQMGVAATSTAMGSLGEYATLVDESVLDHSPTLKALLADQPWITSGEIHGKALPMGGDLEKQLDALVNPQAAAAVTPPVAPIPSISNVPPSTGIPTPSVPPLPTPPVPTKLSDVYDYSASTASYAASHVQRTTVSTTALTQVYDDAVNVGTGKLSIRWAEEQQGKARILRVRDVKMVGQASDGDQLGGFIGALRGSLTDYVGSTQTDAERILLNKKAVAKVHGLEAILADSGWKETKEYWVLGGEDLLQLAEDLNVDKLTKWAKVPTLGAAAPLPEPAGLTALEPGIIGGPTVAPKKLTPAFLYGYDPTVVSKATATKVGEEAYSGSQAAVWQLGTTKGVFSVSPSGHRSGLVRLEAAPGTTPEQLRDSAFTMLRQAAEDGITRDKGFFVKPEFYDQMPAIRDIVIAAGGTEANYNKLGVAVQIDKNGSQKLLKILTENTPTGLNVPESTGEWLHYEATTLAEVLATTPTGTKGAMTWTVKGKPIKLQVQGTEDWATARIVSMGAGDVPNRATATAAQIYWLSQQGAGRIEVAKAVLDESPGLRQWLLGVGGHVDGNVAVLDGAAVNNARKSIAKDALPVALGGKPLPYSVLDDMAASPEDVVKAALAHQVEAGKLESVSRFSINGHQVETGFSKTKANIHWSTFTRGEATVGEGRAAAAAQLRTFANEISQNISIERLDVAEEVLKAHPGMRDAMAKYGGTYVPAANGQSGYMSMTRTQVGKLRADLDQEFAQVGAGAGSSYITQQAALIQWPTADEIAVKTTQRGSARAAIPATQIPTDVGATEAVSTLGGSTGAKLTKDRTTGALYVEKRGANRGHVLEEGITDDIYAAFGYAVPQHVMIDTPEGLLKRSQYFDPAEAKMLPDWWKSATPAEREELKAQMQQGIVLDAILGNRDVIGPLDGMNIMVSPNGVPIRIDNGGALRYRAQGQLKSDFGAAVTELDRWTSGRDNWSTRLFKGVTDGELRRQAEYLEKNRAQLLALVPEEIRPIVSARLDNVLEQTKAYLPGPKPVLKGLEAKAPRAAAKRVAKVPDELIAKDAAGNEWKFVPTDRASAERQKAVAAMAEHLGLPVPPTRYYTINVGGQEVSGTLQKLIPGGKSVNSVAELDKQQTAQMVRHSVLDWLVGNDNANAGHWLIGPDGQLWALDKSRTMQGWKTATDVLSSTNPGHTGKPLIASLFADARANPKMLEKLQPNAVSPVLRTLSKMSDEEYLKLVLPLAEALDDPRYAGKTDLLLRELLARKRSATEDFERYFYGEVDAIMKENPAAVPAEWRAWHAKGGKFSLDPNPEEAWREDLAMLEAKYGRLKRTSEGGSTSSSRAVYSQALGKRQMETAKAVMGQYIDGGLKKWQPGTQIGGSYIAGGHAIQVTPEMSAAVGRLPTDPGVYGSSYLPSLIPQQQYEDWLEVQKWMLLSIADGAPGPRGESYDATFRRLFDPKTGLVALTRGEGSSRTPAKVLADYTKAPRPAASYAVAGRGFGGVTTDGLFPVDQIITAEVTDITRPGEAEYLVRDITDQNVVKIHASHTPMSASEIRKWWEQQKPKL